MPEDRHLTERIKYYTEVFRLVWVSALAIGGGSIGLLLGEPTALRVVVGLVGLLLVGLLVEMLRRLNKEIMELVNRVKGD